MKNCLITQRNFGHCREQITINVAHDYDSSSWLSANDLVGWLVIEAKQITLKMLPISFGQWPAVVFVNGTDGRFLETMVSPISLDAGRKHHAHPVKARPSTAAIGCCTVTGTGQAGGHRRFG